MKGRMFPVLLSVLLLTFVFSLTSFRRAGAQKTSEQVATDQLSSSALNQIAALLSEKESRTPAQRKIDSAVLQAIRENRGEPMAPGLESLRRSEIGQSDGWVILDIRADLTDNLFDALSRANAEVINSFAQFRSIRIRIALDKIERIAELPEIQFIQREQTYDLNQVRPKTDRSTSGESNSQSDFQQRAAKVRQLLQGLGNNQQQNPLPDTGTVNSQGDRTHRADDARATYGHQGEGIKVGVISDSFNSLGVANNDVLSGNLPGPGNPNGNTTPVTVIQDNGTTDEGRAMMQIVHDVVPKAQLYFATANGGAANFANNILLLQAAGCNVIVDDVSYFNEAPFQSGPVGQAVETVTAAGVIYFSSAGNAGSVLKNTAGVWEGDYNDNGGTSTLSIPGNAKGGTVHDFDSGAPVQQSDTVTVSSTSRPYTLYWSDPLGGSNNDYDFFIMNSTLTTVFDSGTTTQNGTQDPYEQSTGGVFSGDRIVIFKTTAAAVRAIHMNTNRGGLATFTTGQTHSHSATVAAAFNMAAAPAAGPFPNPFSGSSLLETFSSDGPRRMFYNSNGTAITPGNLLFSTAGGTLLNKPDLTAADGVSTTFPAASGLNPFFGTSAASPHAGAIAALIKSANPSLTAAQVRTILETNAVDVETAGPDITSGKGIIQAFQSVGAALAPASAGLALGTVTVTEGSPSNSNGVPEPGESINVVVQLTNPSSAAATSVTATLGPAGPDARTSAFGSADAQSGSVSYGTIPAGGNASNTGTPFRMTVGAGTACGSAIPVVLDVSLGGGVSPISFNFNIVTGTPAVSVPGINVTTTLDLTAPPAGAGYTAATGTQNNRLNRNGVTSSCASPKTTPALQEAPPGAVRHYDSYTITNTNSGAVCYTVTFTTTCNTGTTLYSPTYGNGGFNPSAIQSNYLADSGVANGLPSYSFIVSAGQQFTTVVHEVAATANGNGCVYTIDISGVTVPTCATAFIPRISNFDTDTKSDVAVWHPTDSTWFFRNSSSSTISSVSWGLSSDKPVPGDYDGDRRTDVAVWRPSEGNWYIINSSGLVGMSLINWGSSTDIPVQGDYDGDGKTDAAVFRPSEGTWYIRKSGGGTRVQGWGLSTDKMVQGDYDGDGKTDVAVWRPSEGNWYIVKSTGGTTLRGWGNSTDKPVPADYDGDGKTDIAVWRPSEGNWYIINSSNGSVTLRSWGASTDTPVPADYDGDGKSDIAVWRPSEGNWYIINSSDSSLTILNLGVSIDVPIPTAYRP